MADEEQAFQCGANDRGVEAGTGGGSGGGGEPDSDVVDILRKKREVITGYRIEVTGTRRSDFPRSFETIRLHHVLTGENLSEQAVKQALDLSNTKYCSVAATLRPTANISVTYEIQQVERPERSLSV